LANSSDTAGALHQISFSNKGYQFATAWQGSNIVKLFDLREGHQPTEIMVSEANREDENSAEDFGVQAIGFDYYGSYLLAAEGRSMKVYSKPW